MDKPKVILKNVKKFQGHDGTGLNADIWINGINCMHVYDGAYGGEFEYTENTYKNPQAALVETNIKLLDDYIAQLPEQDTPYGKIKFNRDCYIDEVLRQQELEKLFGRAIVFGKPTSDAYRYINMKKPLSACMLNTLQMYADKVKAECTRTGEQILNANSLIALGVKL